MDYLDKPPSPRIWINKPESGVQFLLSKRGQFRTSVDTAALKAQRNKTDKNDARGLAQLVRSGWFKTVHVKSEESHRLKLLLAHRRTLKRKLLDIENEVRHSMKAWD
jgi:Transposase